MLDADNSPSAAVAAMSTDDDPYKILKIAFDATESEVCAMNSAPPCVRAAWLGEFLMLAGPTVRNVACRSGRATARCRWSTTPTRTRIPAQVPGDGIFGIATLTSIAAAIYEKIVWANEMLKDPAAKAGCVV